MIVDGELLADVDDRRWCSSVGVDDFFVAVSVTQMLLGNAPETVSFSNCVGPVDGCGCGGGELKFPSWLQPSVVGQDVGIELLDLGVSKAIAKVALCEFP